MKQTPVLINLLSIAKYDNAPEYPIQFMSGGYIRKEEDNRYILTYRETQQDEDTGEISEADIELTLEKNRVTMNRKGEYSNTMVFVKDQRFEGTYRTPFGDMDMAVYSRAVQCDAEETKGSVHLKYQLDVQGAYASTNELHLEYTAEGKRTS